MSRVKLENDLRNDILTVASKNLSTEEIRNLNKIFRSIDTDHSGQISYSEFEEAISNTENPVTDNVKDAFNRICKNGIIQYSDFIAAAMDRRILYDKEICWMTFKFFDSDDNGYITVKSIKKALEKLEIWVEDQEILKMIEDAGLKYDN